MGEELIDKAAVVAEIESYISNYKDIVAKTDRNDSTWVDSVSMIDAKIDVLQHLLSFLNTLEVKEIDLEEKATQLSQKYFPDEENIWARSNIEAHKCKSACIEMVEWFKTQKREYLCNEYCKLWHICRNREKFKRCSDYKFF